MCLKIFVVFHNTIVNNNYKCLSTEYMKKSVTFFGVNEIYKKNKIENSIFEYELPIYNPFLQKRGYMETSAYLHIYWNKLYIDCDFVGVCQYDMEHVTEYTSLDKNTIYVLNAGKKVVSNGEWDNLMFPQLRNLDFIIQSYNSCFNTNYTKNDLENLPLSLWQTNIYPKRIFEELCSWLELFVEDIYPWCNQLPYETHWGSIGGYTERAITIFNCFKIYEGVNYENLNLRHRAFGNREQYNTKSFLNDFDIDIQSKITNILPDNSFKEVTKDFNDHINIVESHINNTTQIHLVIKQNEKVIKSKPILLLVVGSEFNHKYNILYDNLEGCKIYYKQLSYNSYQVYIEKENKIKLGWTLNVDNILYISETKLIKHFITKMDMEIPLYHKYTSELTQRWSNHELETNSKILEILRQMSVSSVRQYIFDAGCHVGDTLLMMAVFLKRNDISNIYIIGVDPDIEKINFIRDILKLNDLATWIQLYPSGLSNYEHENLSLTLNKKSRNSGAWTVEQSTLSNRADCYFTTIDSICKNKSVRLMHLDLEGYEVYALEGGTQTIKTYKPIIIAEEEHSNLKQLDRTFKNFNYKFSKKIGGDRLYIPQQLDFTKYTMVNPLHIEQLQQFTRYINEHNLSGCVVECGVWKGGMIMSSIEIQKQYDQNRMFYLYDTYEGMTEPTSDKDLHQDKIKYSKLKEQGLKWHEVSLENVKNNISLCNYDEDKIKYITGDVTETLNIVVPSNIAILRLDTDWYEPTKKELEILYPKVVNGGFIIIDDYNNKDSNGKPRGARVAADEYLEYIKNDIKILPQVDKSDNAPFCFQKTIHQTPTITCYSYSNNRDVYGITYPILKDYCDRYNYDVQLYHDNLEKVYKPHWNKIHYAMRLLEECKSDYICWFDHDIVIKNVDIRLDNIIKEYSFDISNELFMMSKDPASNYPFNTGVILFKNNCKTLDIFKKFLHIRNNPRQYKLLNKYGGMSFHNSGMQDTRSMLVYFEMNDDKLLSVPHRVLQSFYGQAEYYKCGDFCGHVAGPQGERLISKLKSLVTKKD